MKTGQLDLVSLVLLLSIGVADLLLWSAWKEILT